MGIEPCSVNSRTKGHRRSRFDLLVCMLASQEHASSNSSGWAGGVDCKPIRWCVKTTRRMTDGGRNRGHLMLSHYRV